MDAILIAAMALLGQIVPLLNSASQVAKVIQLLIQILPAVEQLAQELVQPIKNIINALSSNPATDAEQLKQLQDLDAQFDQAFEAAATSAEAEDAT
jgi:predicted PurR-regulated permease PerM